MLVRINPMFFVNNKPYYEHAGYNHLKSFVFEVAGCGEGVPSYCRVVSHDAFNIRCKRRCKTGTVATHGIEKFTVLIIAKTHFKKNEIVGAIYSFSPEILIDVKP